MPEPITPEENLLLSIITSLVDSPEAVKIIRSVDDMGILLTLSISKNDMGQVIGKEGVTAKAIRTIIRAVGMKHKARVNVKITEPEVSRQVSEEELSTI